jgi:hypothetical protein
MKAPNSIPSNPTSTSAWQEWQEVLDTKLYHLTPAQKQEAGSRKQEAGSRKQEATAVLVKLLKVRAERQNS